ncbi:monocarboxylate transporter 6-like isoform X1 [Amphiura filiformis]|uniref:monocarboxylate transporter 6-like isoform X1 n=2 Tax=Amphiura filiformis TaxID=82378 RepID=UPI003B21F328
MIAKDIKWSWVILAAVTFIMFLEAAILKGFSVLLPDLKEQLSSQTWVIGSLISIITGWGYVVGLSAGPLKKRFGARVCLMVSGLVSSCGLIICACATNVNLLLLGMIPTGFMLFQENVSVGIIPEYFEKYYDLAVSIYCFNTSSAIIISPLFTQMFLDIYGWRGTALMLCGLNMHSILCGALVTHQEHQIPRQLEKHELLPTRHDDISHKDDQSSKSGFKIFKTVFKTFSFNLLTSIPFIARVILPAIVYGWTFASWLIYIVSFALSNGASMKQSAVVATCGGIGNAIIKIVLPYLNSILTYRQLMYIASFVMAVSLGLTTVFYGVIGMSLASFFFCSGIGIIGTVLYFAIKEVVDEDQYTNAVAWYHVFYGFAMIGGALVTGLIFDTTGSFILSFTLLAAVSLLIAVSLGLEEIWAAVNKNKNIQI